MAAPSIVSTVPVSGVTGVPVNTTISIIFDQEVDTWRLEKAVFLEGPDESKAIGPFSIGRDPPETDEDIFLNSAGYKGIVDVDYSFQRVDGSGNVVPYYDYGSGAGAGSLYRTKLILTPSLVLAGLTEYTVYIVGDEDQTDSFEAGVSSRTVYDTIKGAVTGNGEVFFYGGYTGSLRDRFHLEIITGGQPGTATYEWWTDASPIHRTGTTSTGNRLLKDGVYVRFESAKTYDAGDTFSVWCDVPVYMSSSYSFSFTTSTQTIEELPTASTTITGISGIGSSTSSSVLSILETTPSDRQSLVASSITAITVVFSDTLDSSTITDSAVTVEGHAVDETIDLGIEFTETLTKTLSVSGSTLTITLDADQVYDNNLIVVTLDSTIGSASVTLGTDYEFFFGTTLTPFYSGARLVQLRLGSVGNSFAPETLNMAIWEASREALALAPPTASDSESYLYARRAYVTCLAAWNLIGGGKASVGGKRKRLADLDVSSDEGLSDAIIDDLQRCIDRYELGFRSGGKAGFGASLRPLGVVKGSDDPDEPAFGRTWDDIPTTPIANVRYTQTGWRRYYHTYKRKN